MIAILSSLELQQGITSEEVGQLLAKHHGKIARVSSFMRGLLRSEHLCDIRNMEAFERQECQATILRENSTICIYCFDLYYDEAFTIPSLPFLRLHVIYCHFSFLDKPSERRTCIIPNTEALISKLDGLKSPCIVNVKASAIFEPFKVNKT